MPSHVIAYVISFALLVRPRTRRPHANYVTVVNSCGSGSHAVTLATQSAIARRPATVLLPAATMDRFSDDMSLNKLFVREVEKRRCLYDYTCHDYSNKELQERSWQEIADVVCSTVHECKSRWKNLRAGLTRYLSRPLTLSGARYVKKYYLFDDLQFILPFIRARNRSALNDGGESEQTDGNAHSVENDEELSQDMDIDVKPHILLDDLDSNSDDYSIHFLEQNHRRKKRPVNVAQDVEETPRKATKKVRQNEDFLEAVKNCFSDNTRATNPDLDFFRSILPDIADFTPAKKRLFKQRVLQVIDEIASS